MANDEHTSIAIKPNGAQQGPCCEDRLGDEGRRSLLILVPPLQTLGSKLHFCGERKGDELVVSALGN
ncbi:hypothetical protein A6R68_03755, partial [Neotoma lepida]